MIRKLAYILFVVVLVGFAIREIGNIYGQYYYKSFLPEQLSWIEDLDKKILFFSDEGGPIYSSINYFMILVALLGIGVLRTFRGIKPTKTQEEQGRVKTVHGEQNPFEVAVPEWKSGGIDIFKALSESDRKTSEVEKCE